MFEPLKKSIFIVIVAAGLTTIFSCAYEREQPPTTDAKRSGQELPASLFLGSGLEVPLENYVVQGQYAPLIIDGDPATQGQFPWMVLLTRDQSLEAVCSGALIRPQWVLTAAHCLNVLQQGDNAYVGYLNIVADGSQPFKIIKTFRYDPLNRRNLKDDIALLKLHRAPASKPLSISSTPMVAPYSATMVGYGQDQNMITGHLRYAETEVVDPENCSSIEDLGNRLCVADAKGGICLGDSGGPLVVNVQQDWQLVGVANEIDENVGCGRIKGSRIGAFAPAADYIDWINRKIATATM